MLSDRNPRSDIPHLETLYQKYKQELENSIEAFRGRKEVVLPSSLPYNITILKDNYTQCESCVKKLYDGFCRALKPNNASSALLRLIGCWPRCTLLDTLGLLATVKGLSIDEPWINCLLEFGKAITTYQRARRLIMAAENGKISTFFSEAENVGYIGWDSKKHPDWLLVEIHNDLLIRQVQARVAEEMIVPASSTNSLTQLNMGVGRSTVVVCSWGLTKPN